MLLEKATQFIRDMYEESGQSTEVINQRLQQIENEITDTGTYTHTRDELVYGTRVAWRNSNRCIGRLFWDKLEVRDLRHVKAENDFIDSIEDHIEYATNGGRIRPLISIFSNDIKIYNEQLLRYAGYEDMGDPKSIEATLLAEKLGWIEEKSEFNILPLMYRIQDKEMKYHEYRPGIIKEVDIKHEQYPGLEQLGFKWYAVPIISNMDLEIGGIKYHAAPFNGWYMETEVGVRNFTDEYRYNKLKEIATAFNLDTSRTSTYWRDRALVEFNYAVYHSFKNAGVSMVDHITASKQFKQFEKKEQRAGREVTGKWSWLAPPLSPSLTHNYHKGFNDTIKSPSLLYRTNRAQCPFHN